MKSTPKKPSELEKRKSELEKEKEWIEEKIGQVNSELWKLRNRFSSSGAPCPECGSQKPPKKTHGFGRSYEVECKDCGYTVMGTD
jgi:predicted RNA-binding Zn-ribbon protein involved in translation (DUF1610 family)